MKRTLLILLVMILTSPLAFSNAAVQQEVRLGTQVAATILGKYSQTSNAALIRYVNLVGQSIVSTSGRKDIRYYFTVLQSDERFALACPGGFIFITEGMINDLNNEAELAGILAHEIAHINQKHVVDQVIPAADQSSALIHRLLTAKHTTTTVAFNEVSAKASELLLNKGFNQSDEYDADMAAIFYLKNTGYAPSSYIDVIKRLPHDTTTHNKDHPTIEERINDLVAMFPMDYLNDGTRLEDRFKRYATP